MTHALDICSATLSLTGIAEASQITLPASVTTTNVAVTAIVSGAGESPDVEFTLERQGIVQSPGISGAPYAITFTNLIAGKYFLTANLLGSPGVSADVSFDIISTYLQPANDLWIQASEVDLGVIVLGTNTYATAETDEPNHAGNAAGRSLWWRWQANASGPVTATTLGSSFDTVLAIYTGSNVASLTLVAANDDAGSTNKSSQASFAAIQDTTYFLAVDGAFSASGTSASGNVQLQLLAASPPSVSIASPAHGAELVVASPTGQTNVTALASISDPAGISRVEYALDGAGASRTGTTLPPYQLPLTNLAAGDYLLSVSAMNSSGLICEAHASFSIRPLSPEILLVDSSPAVPSGFKFAVTGLKGMNYELQSSTNLLAWNRLSLWTNFDGAQRFTDTNAAQFEGRFYRVVSQ
ncbi:MAG TPA: Ig-like domain-containing protein [Candidatus Limnocylindria bacterium]|nr:Ig-like domain-containing protein [Candidatus Limnocylindria bacterium]